jgi:hypothetical protein
MSNSSTGLILAGVNTLILLFIVVVAAFLVFQSIILKYKYDDIKFIVDKKA